MKTQDNSGFFEMVPVPAATNIRFETILDTGSFIPTHWHHALEIIFLLEGQMEVTMQQKKYILSPNDCLVIDADVLHSTKCIHSCNYLLVQIPTAFLSTYIPQLDQIHFTWDIHPKQPQLLKKTKRIKGLLLEMKHLYETMPDGYLLSFNSLLFSLLFALYEDFTLRLPHAGAPIDSKKTHRLEPVMEYTLSHYNQPISIEEIAGVAALKPEYFCRFFKKEVGITYLEYLNRIRLSHIYQDLLETTEPVYKILEAHGFTNYKLFRRMFQEQFHATPTQIRKGISQ